MATLGALKATSTFGFGTAGEQTINPTDDKFDTFLVRSTLVPAAVLAIGSRVWWPSRLAHEGEPGGPHPEDEPEGEEQRPGDAAPARAG